MRIKVKREGLVIKVDIDFDDVYKTLRKRGLEKELFKFLHFEEEKDFLHSELNPIHMDRIGLKWSGEFTLQLPDNKDICLDDSKEGMLLRTMSYGGSDKLRRFVAREINDKLYDEKTLRKALWDLVDALEKQVGLWVNSSITYDIVVDTESEEENA